MTSLSPRGSPRTHSRNLRGPLKRVVTPQSEPSDSEESDYDESSPNSDESSEDSSNSASDVERSPSPILKRRKSSPMIQMRTATDPDFAHRKKQIEEELSKKLLEDDTDEIIEDIIDEDLRSDEPSLKIEEPQIKIEQDLPQIDIQLSDPMIPESNEILPPKIQSPPPIDTTETITTTTTTAAAVTMETTIDADMSEFSEILLGLEKPKFHNCGQIVWTKYEDSFWPGLTIEVTSAPQYVLKRREENKQIVKLFGYKDNCVWAYPRDIVVFKSEDQFDVKKKKRNFTKAISEMKMYLNKDNMSSPPQQQQQVTPVVRPQRRQQTRKQQQIEEDEQVPITKKNNDTSSRSTRRRTNTTQDIKYNSIPTPSSSSKTLSSSKSNNNNKKSSSSSARINRPRLGEIPELENKRVSCGLKSGRIHKNIICCDCCQVDFSVGSFEEHAGRGAARNPYKTILVTESGKPLDEYRYCTYCHTRETGFWREGPFGDRTLCDPCGQKWKEGLITEVLFKPIVVSSKTAECRRKTEFPAKKITSHTSNCLAVPVIDITDFTPDIYLEQVIYKRIPLVLRNANAQLTPSLWTLDHLRQSHGDAEIQVRYMEMEESDDSQFAVIKDTQKTLSWFIDHMRNPDFSRDPDLDIQCVFPGRKPVVYAKDFSFGEIVPEWLDDLSLKVPLCLVPHERNDIMGNVPPNVRNIVWMGYMGNTGSRTPLHVDKLATVAFNVHVCGEGVKNWWLVSSDEIEKLEKIIEENGGNLYKDAYWMSPSELENTGMKMWYHQQQKGDMVIVPPNVPHTVINEGGFSCAVAANVMHENVVEDAWKAEKINRSINRVSIYRLKNTVYHSVNKMINEYRNTPTQQICDSLQKLIGVFEKIILEEEEQISPNADIVFVPSDEYFLCDRCSCDIFNRRYHCSECKVGDYDLCVQCYLAINKEHYHEMKLYQKISLTSLHDMLREARDICEKHADIKRPDQRMSVTSLLLN